MIKALIYDLDGTLADTLPSLCQAVNMAMDHYSAPHRTCEDVRIAIGNGARMLVKRLLPAHLAEDEDKVTEALNYYNACYAKTYTAADHCYDGMKNAVMELCRRGYASAVLSNKPDKYTVALCNILFPDNTFAVTQGQKEGVPTKPDPTAPLDIAARMGFRPEECAFIGDSEVDIRTAKNAGMTSVGCAWGYRGADALREAGADIVIDSPHQLLTLFN